MHEKVRAVPYKINVYRRGDFLIAHADSPEEKLIGTTLIDLSKRHNSSFRVDNKKWKTRENNTCSFYANLIHEVTPVENDF